MSEPLIVTLVTVPSEEIAQGLAEKLLDSRLAACVNILPQITSVYTWEGKRERSSELLLLIKSPARLFSELEAFVKENHPYEVPEILAIPATKVSADYAAWLIGQTK